MSILRDVIQEQRAIRERLAAGYDLHGGSVLLAGYRKRAEMDLFRATADKMIRRGFRAA